MSKWAQIRADAPSQGFDPGPQLCTVLSSGDRFTGSPLRPVPQAAELPCLKAISHSGFLSAPPLCSSPFPRSRKQTCITNIFAKETAFIYSQPDPICKACWGFQDTHWSGAPERDGSQPGSSRPAHPLHPGPWTPGWLPGGGRHALPLPPPALSSCSHSPPLRTWVKASLLGEGWYLSMKKATDLLETYWDLSLSPRRG